MIAHEITEQTTDTVRALMIAGLSCARIADVLGISHDTLERRYADVLRTARDEFTREVVTCLARKIREGDTASILFYLKCRAGWRETSRVELTGADGQPVAIDHKIAVDAPRETYEQWCERQKRKREDAIDVTPNKITNGTNTNGTNGANGSG